MGHESFIAQLSYTQNYVQSCAGVGAVLVLKSHVLIYRAASDYFNSSRVAQLITNLPDLEDFTFSGYDLTDSIWPYMARLRHLCTLNSMALSSYSFDGLLNYIDALRPTNRGLVLSVMSQNFADDLSEEEKATIQQSIAAKVGGRFEFVLHRETGDADYDSDSD